MRLAIDCGVRWLLVIAFLCGICLGQESGAISDRREGMRKQAGPDQDSGSQDVQIQETTLQKIRDLPIVWLIGPYIPPQGPLLPLTKSQRTEVYFRQTFLTAGTYFARAFSAGIDQARGTPYEWGGGAGGYGKRYASRYGQFMIASTLHAVGDGALGYESRYDLCRCQGFWPRTRHAVARNFYTYNRTEWQKRPAIPLYAGSFGAGMIANTWLPGHHNTFAEGAYGAMWQAGIGSGYNFVSEFALDFLRKMKIKKH
jgi:hypothetical protein